MVYASQKFEIVEGAYKIIRQVRREGGGGGAWLNVI